MSSLAEALAEHGPAFLSKFQNQLPVHIERVISLTTRCRTGALGGVRYQCDGCGREHWVGRSCGNRHCAACGHEKTQVWIEKQRDRLMPVHHFLVTFTVPRELGFFGVQHTWGRDLQTYHPHIHYVVPSGGVKLDESGPTTACQSTPRNLLFHHGTLIRVYKAKLADELRACGLYDQVPSEAWSKDFVVDIQAVGHGVPTLKYLAPYVHRVAISDKRITAVNDSSVSYTVRPSKSNATITRTIPGDKIVAAFAQYILPKGFQKIRHYGWMSPATSTAISPDTRLGRPRKQKP